MKPFIFSSYQNNYVSNYLSMFLKYYIYRSKFREGCAGLLTVDFFNGYLKQKLITMKYVAKINNKLNYFQSFWSDIYDKIIGI